MRFTQSMACLRPIPPLRGRDYAYVPICRHMSPYEDNLKGLVRALAYCPLMVKAKQGKSAFNRPSHLVQALLMLAESLVVCVGLHIAARKHRNPLLIIPERGL